MWWYGPFQSTGHTYGTGGSNLEFENVHRITGSTVRDGFFAAGVAAGGETQFQITWGNTAADKFVVWALYRNVGAWWDSRGLETRATVAGTTGITGAGFNDVAKGVTLQVFGYDAATDWDPVTGPSGFTQEEHADGDNISATDIGLLLYSKDATTTTENTSGVSQDWSSGGSGHAFQSGVTMVPAERADRYPTVEVVDSGSWTRGAGVSTSITWNFASALEAGDYVCIYAYDPDADGAFTSIISSISGLTFSSTTQLHQGDNHEWWHAQSGSGGETSITMTLNGSNTDTVRGFVAVVVRGAANITLMAATTSTGSTQSNWDSAHVTDLRGLDVLTLGANFSGSLGIWGEAAGTFLHQFAFNGTAGALNYVMSGAGVGYSPASNMRPHCVNASSAEYVARGWYFDPA